MLDYKGFDLWADNYDETVEISDNDNSISNYSVIK